MGAPRKQYCSHGHGPNPLRDEKGRCLECKKASSKVSVYVFECNNGHVFLTRKDVTRCIQGCSYRVGIEYLGKMRVWNTVTV